jgi:hypothetical protein
VLFEPDIFAVNEPDPFIILTLFERLFLPSFIPNLAHVSKNSFVSPWEECLVHPLSVAERPRWRLALPHLSEDG